MAPLVPNTLEASVNASVELDAFLILSIVSCNPSDKVLPSLAYPTAALLIEERAALESTPAFSIPPINVVASSNDNPSSLI